MGRGVVGPALVLAAVIAWVQIRGENLGQPFSLGPSKVVATSTVVCKLPPPMPSHHCFRPLIPALRVDQTPPEDPVALAFFEEGREILRLARASTGDDLSFDVTLEPGLLIELESAFGLARRYVERAAARGLRPDECQALIARCLVGMADGTRMDDPEALRAQARHRLTGIRLAAIQDPDSLLALAETYEALDDARDALAAYDACTRRHPYDGRAHLGAALLSLRTGVGSAKEFWRHYDALKLHPDLVDRFHATWRRRTSVDDAQALFAEH